jgi:anti-sigma B factor antagonist
MVPCRQEIIRQSEFRLAEQGTSGLGFLLPGLGMLPVVRRPAVQLRLSNRVQEGVAVVDCDGRVIFGEESASLRDAVKDLINKNKQIVLNLGGVNYIDSGGLGTLVSLYTTARNAGGTLRLANLTQRVGDLLQVTKLLTVFEVFDSVDEAVKSFSQGAAA